MTIDADNSKLYSNGQIGWNVQANTLYADFHGEEALFGALAASTAKIKVDDARRKSVSPDDEDSAFANLWLFGVFSGNLDHGMR